ncbi:LysE family transporter [Kribbella sp. NPDC003505]|uniref:LysE family transporter n=1 Tax=Kribbella sp. NPDC003505 TaxID=3154448 RepID=UPI0033B4B5CA
MRTAVMAGLLAGYGIAMPVGAVATYLVALTARTTLWVGACAALGVATADGLYALVSTIGGSALVPLIEPITTPLQWVSAVVLAALAFHGAMTAIHQFRTGQVAGAADKALMSPVRAYLGLLAITIMNPITVIYFAALVLASQSGTATSRWESAAFVTAAFAASASWQLLLAGSGALLGRVLTGRHGRLITSLASACVITGLATHLLVAGS